MSTASDRYARAMFGVSEERKSIDNDANALVALADAVENSPVLAQLLRDPRMQSERLGVLNALAEKISATPQIKALLRALDNAQRLPLLVGLAASFQRLADKHAGRVRGTVTSAVPLADAEQKSIATALSKQVGKSVTLEYKVDPALIAGVVAKVQDLTWDGSVRTQLQRMQQALRQ